MSHVETNPHVCPCSCHDYPADSLARPRHGVPCCVGTCRGCGKRYTTDDALEECREGHKALYRKSLDGDEDDLEMPW